MKLKILVVSFFLVLNVRVTLTYAANGDYVYQLTTGKKEIVEINISIEENPPYQEVTILEGGYRKEVVLIKNRLEMQNVDYYNHQGKKYLQVVYDYQQRKVSVFGSKRVDFKLKERMYDHNGALFFVLTNLFSKEKTDFTFTLIQSKSFRTVKMDFKYVGTEWLFIQGHEIEASKYEMGLSSDFLSLFWPHRYYFWYSPEGKFLQYEGFDENGDIERITLVKSTE